MELATRLNTTAAKLSVWTTQNPTATRLILLALPVVVAAITALATQQPVYACPVQSGCGGGD
jgi:heme/copper-type cytochrome/quinol oxidase subunit 1